MVWALASDPALRSALVYTATQAQCARHRVRNVRRRVTLAVAAALALALVVRGLLWLIVL